MSKLLSRRLLGAVLFIAALPASAGVEDEVARAARRHLLEAAEAAGLAEPAVTLEVAGARRQAPACAQPLRIEPLDTRHASRLRFAAVCPGHDDARAEFVVRAELTAHVAVATAAVAAGRPIAAQDVALERRPLGAATAPTSDLDAVVGLSSRRALRAGQVIDTPALAAPVLVRRGAAVRIVARNGQVLVTAAGEALAAGRQGELIEVRNSATGKVIQARVTGSNEVAPTDMPISASPQSGR